MKDLKKQPDEHFTIEHLEEMLRKMASRRPDSNVAMLDVEGILFHRQGSFTLCIITAKLAGESKVVNGFGMTKRLTYAHKTHGPGRGPDKDNRFVGQVISARRALAHAIEQLARVVDVAPIGVRHWVNGELEKEKPSKVIEDPGEELAETPIIDRPTGRTLSLRKGPSRMSAPINRKNAPETS